jgi:Rrf2 family protein
MSYSLGFSQAVVATIYIADKVQQGFFEFTPTTQLAEDLNIPRPTAVKILQSLNQAGIIETREGSKGGVRLAKLADEVTVLDIFVAVERKRPLFQTRLNIKVKGHKPTRVQQAIGTLLADAETALKDNLQQTTIADLISTLYAE